MGLTLAEKLQKSALNIKETSSVTEDLAPKAEKKEIHRETLSLKKENLKEDIERKESESEVQRLKRELQKQKEAYRKLEEMKVVKKSFKNYKAKTYRITHEQEEMLRQLWKSLPTDIDRLENITSNSFLRAILENVLERQDEIDLYGISTENDVYTEIKKLFK